MRHFFLDLQTSSNFSFSEEPKISSKPNSDWNIKKREPVFGNTLHFSASLKIKSIFPDFIFVFLRITFVYADEQKPCVNYKLS